LAKAFPVESLPSELKPLMHDFLENNSDDGTVVFSVKNNKNFFPFVMGDDYGLAALQEYADGLEKDEIIKELNQE
jgi:hypothetical protein